MNTEVKKQIYNELNVVLSVTVEATNDHINGEFIYFYYLNKFKDKKQIFRKTFTDIEIALKEFNLLKNTCIIEVYNIYKI